MCVTNTCNYCSYTRHIIDVWLRFSFFIYIPFTLSIITGLQLRNFRTFFFLPVIPFAATFQMPCSIVSFQNFFISVLFRFFSFVCLWLFIMKWIAVSLLGTEKNMIDIRTSIDWRDNVNALVNEKKFLWKHRNNKMRRGFRKQKSDAEILCRLYDWNLVKQPHSPIGGDKMKWCCL